MATFFDFLGNIVYSVYKLWAYFIYIIMGMLYCIGLKKLNGELLFRFDVDNYIGMMQYDSGKIWWYFIMAIALILVCPLLIFYTMRNFTSIIDGNIYTLILFIFCIISIPFLLHWIITLIYVPIFKIVVVGLGLVGLTASVVSSFK
ncbi:hypothetical protein D920_01933 [Enterococcus faecalis 13-SD-W-01]|nr:hypothetical protein D920_01933 [Enterococcus faecalis 13-SD-W-01]